MQQTPSTRVIYDLLSPMLDGSLVFFFEHENCRAAFAVNGSSFRPSFEAILLSGLLHPSQFAWICPPIPAEELRVGRNRLVSGPAFLEVSLISATSLSFLSPFFERTPTVCCERSCHERYERPFSFEESFGSKL